MSFSRNAVSSRFSSSLFLKIFTAASVSVGQNSTELPLDEEREALSEAFMEMSAELMFTRRLSGFNESLIKITTANFSYCRLLCVSII